MNLIELLMAEHASLRIHFRYFHEQKSDLIFELARFISDCHAKVEDEIVFPMLLESFGKSDEKVSRVSKQFAEDHKLIDALGEQLRGWTAEGESDLLRKQIALYIDTVADHNANEEAYLFSRWKEINSKDRQDATLHAKKIIEDFGLDRYFPITGISNELFDSVS